MGLFGFLKKKPKKEEKIQTKLKFEETGSFILDKEKSIKDKEKEAFEIVQEKIKESTHQIKEKIQILEKVDVNAKKANDRAKNIVKDSLKAYVELVEGFMYKLKDLEYSDFEQVTNKIGKLFLDFNKSSLLSYEKATYLVGKEMVAVRDNIKLFSKELLKIFDENKTLLDSFKIIKKIKVKQSQLTIQDKAIKENKELVKALDEKIKQVKEKHKKALEDLEKFKQTKDYREIQEKKEKIKESEQILKTELIRLRSLIDFKALGNFFHFSEEKIKIVKEYKENFSLGFSKNSGQDILKLLDESKASKPEINKKVDEIKDQIKELHKDKEILEKDKTREHLEDIDKIDLDLDHLNVEQSKQSQRLEKLTPQKQEIIDSLKKDFEGLDVEIE